MKSVFKKIGLLTIIALLTFSVYACSSDTTTDETDNDSTTTDDTTATEATDDLACDLNLTFLDADGNQLTDYTADVSIDNGDSQTYTPDDNGMITLSDVERNGAVAITLSDSDGNTLASSDLYIFTADTSSYSNNDSGILYLYAESSTTSLDAQLQVNDASALECVNLDS